MTEVTISKQALFDAELQMRIVLDAAMRYQKSEEDLTDEERARIKNWHIRDTEVWCGNVGYYDVAEQALWQYFQKLGNRLLGLLGGNETEYDKVIERLCDRGSGGHYHRFMFIEHSL